jgi:Fe-S-cluster containining protein
MVRNVAAEREAARRMLPILRESLAPFQMRAERVATCRRGCGDCCHVLVGVTMAEAAMVLDRLEHDEARRATLPALRARLESDVEVIEAVRREHAADPSGPSLNQRYLATKRPCPFLDRSAGECTIYPFRFLACRVHYVVSSPEACAPGADPRTVSAIDASAAVVECATAMAREMDPLPRKAGTMQEMLLAAFALYGLTAVE